MMQPLPAGSNGKPPIDAILQTKIPTIEICDVGAMLEGTDRYADLVTRNLANVSGFEPNPAELQKLQMQNRPRRQYFPTFLGNGGSATFYTTHYPGCSSLYEPDPAVIDLFTSLGAKLPDGNFAVTQSQPVQTIRLDDVPNLPAPDYLKLDVQGAELAVLEGAIKALNHAVVIEAEVEFVGLYKNQPLFGDLQVFLRQHHFVLHKFIDVCGRSFRPVQLGRNPHAAMSQLLWADAIFVRNFAQLDRYSDDQLLKAAAILYEIYNSHDLVHYLLSAYDQRRTTLLARLFAQAIATIPTLPVLYMNQKLQP